MECSIRGVVRAGPARVLVVAFGEAHNADEVSAVLDRNFGREVKVTLRWPETDRGRLNGADAGWEPSGPTGFPLGACCRPIDHDED